MKLNQLIAASAVGLTLAACGGGGGNATQDSAKPPVTSPVSVVFSGTAAVGAPLAGSVTVKDSKGVTKTAQIGGNGAYSVDVSGMTGPFVFRATGSANGRTYTVHSIANSADANGKINITQLTDLVAANVGGQLAQDYFDQFEKNGVAATATPAAIDAEVAKLKEKLQPILTALGVDANADLLRTPFTPLSSPLDSALDAIHVSVDPTTSVATISTTANASVITDDIKQKAAAETNPPKLAADNVSTAISDAPLVKKALTDVIGKFANGLPSASDFTALVTSNFLNDDENAQTYFGDLATDPSLVGATFTDIEIRQIDYSDPAKITARVSFTAKSKEGLVLDRIDDWLVRKSPTDGVWRVHGNQRVLVLEAFSTASKISGANGTCYRTGLNFNIVDRNRANSTTAGVIHHIIVTGPGLPQTGVRYNANDLSGNWLNTVDSTTTYMMSTDCAGPLSPLGDDGVARIPDNAAYVFTAYDASDKKLKLASGTADGTYTLKVQRRPLTLTETKNNPGFPIVSDQTIAALSNFSNRTVSFAATNILPNVWAWVRVDELTSNAVGAYDVETAVQSTAAGAISDTIQLPSLGTGETIKTRRFSIEYRDSNGRNLQSVHNR